METKHDKEFREALAACRDMFENRVLYIDEEIKKLQEQRKLAKQVFNVQKESLQEMFNAPTEHSISCRRKQQAYNLKRAIGGKLSEWQSPVIDAQNAQVQFEMKEDHIAMTITIPFKPYELP